MPNDATNPPRNSPFEPLTFDASAAPGAATCTKCGTALRGSYHLIGESMACSKCRYAADAQSEGATGARPVMRAVLFGAGAAIVGAAGYYAFVKITGIEWALLTALVGLGVGMAVRIGSRGHGGRRYQFVAVILTYFAMAGAYLPFMLSRLADGAKEPRATAGAGTVTPPPLHAYADSMAALQKTDEHAAEPEDSDAAAAPSVAPEVTLAENTKEITPSKAFAVLAAALLLGLLTTPVFVAFASPISGLFIVYALYRAWKSNAGGFQAVAVSGPFRLQQTPPDVPAS